MIIWQRQAPTRVDVHPPQLTLQRAQKRGIFNCRSVTGTPGMLLLTVWPQTRNFHVQVIIEISELFFVTVFPTVKLFHEYIKVSYDVDGSVAFQSGGFSSDTLVAIYERTYIRFTFCIVQPRLKWLRFIFIQFEHYFIRHWMSCLLSTVDL